MNLSGISEKSKQLRVSAVAKALSNSTGVLHLGAHLGQEAADYAKSGKPVIWVEALPHIHARLVERLKDFPNQTAYCAVLGDVAGRKVTFKVSNNWEGVSSSIFEFGSFGSGKDSLWPELGLKMVSTIDLEMTTLDALIASASIPIAGFNHWIVDLQGAELLTLKGGRDALASCRTMLIEISQQPVYEGGALWPELREFLAENGFTPAWPPEKIHDDVLFLS
jgi:FkbM family methyltransferase